MTSRKTISLALLLGVLSVVSAGCYTTESQHRPGIKSVAVPIMIRGRGVYRRDLEMRLTSAVVKRIEQDTPYKVTSKDRADTLLTGSLDLIRQQVLNFNPDTGLPRELEITFTVAITWTDLRTGKVLAKHTNIRATGTYVPHHPLDEDFFQGSEDVIDRTARAIVERMEADW